MCIGHVGCSTRPSSCKNAKSVSLTDLQQLKLNDSRVTEAYGLVQ